MARPELWLCRHGETDWSRHGRHTSHTDLMLTSAGVDESRRLIAALAGVSFDLVLTSPLRRSSDTADLLGFPDARRDPALAEWDYGDYEGLTTPQIRERVPDWTVWTHVSPGGETADQVGARADRVIDRVLVEATERVFVVSHGHFLRVLAARWLDQQPRFGRHLLLGTGTLSVLGWERDTRAIARWNHAPSLQDAVAGTAPSSGAGASSTGGAGAAGGAPAGGPPRDGPAVGGGPAGERASEDTGGAPDAQSGSGGSSARP